MGSGFSPNSTSLKLNHFRELAKYATMMNNKSRELNLNQDVTESVDCPFHYTEGRKVFPHPRQLVGWWPT